MNYYSIKDAIAEGVMVKVRLKCDLSNKYIQELFQNRPIENNCVYLPYYMAECIVNTDYMEIAEIIEPEKHEEMEGSPEHMFMQGVLLYSALEKIEKIHPMTNEDKEIVKQMHLVRAIKGSRELAETSVHPSYEKEEASILKKGQIGWKTH